ncbi:MAG TPA: ribosome silencing factor [Planctomycetota bacterium]|nr:ribosome silencing factor [Planctomycetota bacterium]
MPTSRQLALRCARVCESKKATDIVILDMSKHTFITDYFVICSTQSERQSKAIADHLALELKQAGVPRLGMEGAETGRWVLQDFGGVIVHVFLESVRGFYDLEALWEDAPRLPFAPKRRKPKKKGL